MTLAEVIKKGAQFYKIYGKIVITDNTDPDVCYGCVGNEKFYILSDEDYITLKFYNRPDILHINDVTGEVTQHKMIVN